MLRTYYLRPIGPSALLVRLICPAIAYGNCPDNWAATQPYCSLYSGLRPLYRSICRALRALHTTIAPRGLRPLGALYSSGLRPPLPRGLRPLGRSGLRPSH